MCVCVCVYVNIYRYKTGRSIGFCFTRLERIYGNLVEVNPKSNPVKLYWNSVRAGSRAVKTR